MGDLLIFTSPPASGKTFWIKNFAAECEEKILVISPLRALADECRKNWGEDIFVMTPEEWLVKRERAQLVIFDEFHLLGYWGNTFRPVMWDVFEELSLEAELVIGLTATLSEEWKNEVKKLSAGFSEIHWQDNGNQTLKNLPHQYFKLSRNFLEKCVLHLHPKGTSLLFCEFREEVGEWERKLKKHGYSVWGCRGGEAAEFSLKVGTEAPPDFIVATTVLSHGVNLPSIRRVFFLYPVGNIDFWIQMTARGGRGGEEFEVFALEPPHGLRWSRTGNFFVGIFLRFRISFSLFLDQLEQCFLKE